MAATPEPRPDPSAIRHALRRAALLTAGAGIVYGVLTIISWFLLQSDRDVLAGDVDPYIYYTETGQLGGAAIDIDAQGGTRFVRLDDPRVWERGRVVRVRLGWSF